MIEVLVFVTLLKCPIESGWVPRRFENKSRETYELSVLLGEELLIGSMVFGPKSGVTVCLPREAWMVTKRTK